MANIKKSLYLFIIIITFFLISCKETTMNKIIVSDGSGNTYTISKELIEYSPVRPENSSSGVYSGGEPFKKKISSSDYKKIEKAINTIYDTKAIRLSHRTMGSMQITRMNSNRPETIIIESQTKEAIVLQKILGILQ